MDILTERIVGVIAAVVLVSAFYWWSRRRKKKAEASASQDNKTKEEKKGFIRGILDYLGWRLKLAIIVFIIWAILYFIFKWNI